MEKAAGSPLVILAINSLTTSSFFFPPPSLDPPPYIARIYSKRASPYVVKYPISAFG